MQPGPGGPTETMPEAETNPQPAPAGPAAFSSFYTIYLWQLSAATLVGFAWMATSSWVWLSRSDAAASCP